MPGVCLGVGLRVIAPALFFPSLRSPDGWFTPLAGTLVVGGLAVALLAAPWRSRWQQAAGLLALALVGQACSLQLVFAPPYGVYQHYFPWKEVLTSGRGLFLLGLVLQTVITVWVGRRLWSRVKPFFSRPLSELRVFLLVTFLIFAGLKFTQDFFQYGFELILTGWITSISVLNFFLVAASIPGDALQEMGSWLKRVSMHRLFPWMVAGGVTGVAAAIAWFVFEAVPHIPDSVSYFFQAKYFSVGRLYLPAPPDVGAFTIENVVNDGTKWYAYGFPGWPAILALGVLAGVPWLVNPILGGLTVLLTHRLLRRLYSHSTANMVVVLLGVSPWFLFMSASFMGHPIAVVWSLLVLLAVEKERRDGRGLWGIVAGLCLGALLLTRPIDGVLVGGVIGLWVVGVRGARVSPRAVAGLVTAALAVGSLAFAYNYALTGDALYAPHMRWADETWYPGADRLGFGPEIGNVGWPHIDPLPGHGLVDVIINANSNFYMANIELFGWSFGSLGFAALALLLGGLRRADWLFFALLVSMVAGHSFYWFSGGPDFGARYWYQALVPLVVLTVRGMQAVQQRLIERRASELSASRVTAFVLVASLVAFANVVPWRSLGKYHHYRGMSGNVGRMADAYGFGDSLVFVREGGKNDYASAFVFNPPTLDSRGTIYARDTGLVGRAAVAQHFPGRSVWIVAGSSRAAGPFRLVAGPLPPALKISSNDNSR